MCFVNNKIHHELLTVTVIFEFVKIICSINVCHVQNLG